MIEKGSKFAGWSPVLLLLAVLMEAVPVGWLLTSAVQRSHIEVKSLYVSSPF